MRRCHTLPAMPRTVEPDPSPGLRLAAALTGFSDEELAAVVAQSEASRRTNLALRTQARRAVLDVEMLTSAAVAQALGMRGSN